MIANFDKYEESCLKHLHSKTDTHLPYYKEIKSIDLKPMIKENDKNLSEAKIAEIITEEEFVAMKAKDKLERQGDLSMT